MEDFNEEPRIFLYEAGFAFPGIVQPNCIIPVDQVSFGRM